MIFEKAGVWWFLRNNNGVQSGWSIAFSSLWKIEFPLIYDSSKIIVNISIQKINKYYVKFLYYLKIINTAHYEVVNIFTFFLETVCFYQHTHVVQFCFNFDNFRCGKYNFFQIPIIFGVTIFYINIYRSIKNEHFINMKLNNNDKSIFIFLSLTCKMHR